MPWFQEARQESLIAKMKEGIQEPPGPEEVKPAQQADASAPTDVPEGDKSLTMMKWKIHARLIRMRWLMGPKWISGSITTSSTGECGGWHA